MDLALSSPASSMLGDGGRITVGESPDEEKSAYRSPLASIAVSSPTSRHHTRESEPQREHNLGVSLGGECPGDQPGCDRRRSHGQEQPHAMSHNLFCVKIRKFSP